MVAKGGFSEDPKVPLNTASHLFLQYFPLNGKSGGPCSAAAEPLLSPKRGCGQSETAGIHPDVNF